MAETDRPTTARRRVLLIANETCPSGELCTRVREIAGPDGEVLVVAPALTGRLGWLTSSGDDARARALGRVEQSVANLRAAGLDARGEVGDEDPMLATEDALATFPADEIVIATHPPRRSAWLERRVVERARRRFTQPITHIEIDLERERAQVVAPA